MKFRTIGLLIGFMISLSSLWAAGGGFVFLADSTQADSGLQVVLPIRAKGFDSIISFQGTIGFDTSGLQFVGVQGLNLPSLSTANFGTTYTSVGKLTFSWNEFNLQPISVPDSTILFEILFDVIGSQGTDAYVHIVNSPTLIEVVNWNFTPIPYSVNHGNVHIKEVFVCETPDSLQASLQGNNQAELSWNSRNGNASFLVEWGQVGFIPGNGIGSSSGISVQGRNSIIASGLPNGTSLVFYVSEYCDSLNSVLAGPFGFATLAAPTPPKVVLFADSFIGISNQILNVGIKVNAFENIVSAQGSISWDPSVASFQSVGAFGLPNLSSSNFGTSLVAQGKLTFSWNDPSLLGLSLSDSSSLFEISLQLIGQPGANTLIAFSDQPTTIEFADTSFNTIADSTVNGFIHIQDTMLGLEDFQSGNLIYAYPNPTQSSQLFLKIDREEMIIENLKLLNLAGIESKQPIYWLRDGNSVKIELSSAIPNGILLLEIETNLGRKYTTIIVDKH